MQNALIDPHSILQMSATLRSNSSTYVLQKKEPAMDIAGLCLPLKPQKERS
jgi:hypothetical protein